MRHATTCLALCVALAAALPGYIAAAPPEVLVSRPVEREIADEEHFTGRTEASTTVQVRSRLASYLEKVLFKDGAEVKKGEVLFQLDDRQYQAELEKAQAEVARAEARLKLADAEPSFDRIKAASACMLLAERLVAADKKNVAADIYTHLRDTRKAAHESHLQSSADKALQALLQ